MRTGKFFKVTIVLFFLAYFNVVPAQDCPESYYGPSCNKTCSINCVDQLCYQISGTCYQCPPGQTGDQCDQDCPESFYGRNCNKTCSNNCVDQLCDKITGSCHQCPPGQTGELCDHDCPESYYGPNCNKTCSINCVDQLCDQITGSCHQCPPGQTGELCDKDCPESYYGPNCNETCSINCVDQLCDQITGSCYQCPPGQTGELCDQDTCSGDFCKYGGVCTESQYCDCSETDFFGPRCQYTIHEIPIKIYEFINITNDAIITTVGNISVTGNITLNKSARDVSIAIPSGSYLILRDHMTTCLDNINVCTSGFSLTISFRFSGLTDTSRIQVVVTTGAGLVDRVNGVSLYFQSGRVLCYVATSTQQWSIVRVFNLDNHKWYDVTVTWHRRRGLLLLQGNDIFGETSTPTALPQSATVFRPLQIGSQNLTSPPAVMYIRYVITLPMFWEELKRAGDTASNHPVSSSPDDELDVAEIVGIITGVLEFVLAVAGVIVGLKNIKDWYKNRSGSQNKKTDGGHTNQGADTFVVEMSTSLQTTS